MNYDNDPTSKRLTDLEAKYKELVASDAQIEQRYSALLAMLKESTSSASMAAIKAESAAEKALNASLQAAVAAKEASVLGAIKVAETALLAARAAADAAGDAAAAATEAWKSALINAGHNADSDLLRLSINAGDASKAASAAAIKALNVFSDAFEAVKQASLNIS